MRGNLKWVALLGFLPVFVLEAHSIEAKTHSRQSSGQSTAKANDVQVGLDKLFCGRQTESNEEMGLQTIQGSGIYNIMMRKDAEGVYEPLTYSALPRSCQDVRKKSPSGKWVINPDDEWKSLGTNFNSRCLKDKLLKGAECVTVYVNEIGQIVGKLAAHKEDERGNKEWTSVKGKEIGKTGTRAEMDYYAVEDPRWGSLIWVAYPPCVKEGVTLAKYFSTYFIPNDQKEMADKGEQQRERVAKAASTKKSKNADKKNKARSAKKDARAKKEMKVAEEGAIEFKAKETVAQVAPRSEKSRGGNPEEVALSKQSILESCLGENAHLDPRCQ